MQIGPNTVIRDSHIGDDTRILPNSVVEEAVDDVPIDHVLDNAGAQMVDLDGVGAVVLDLHTQLRPLDAQRGVFCDQDGFHFFFEVETGGQDPMIRPRRVEDRGKPV